MDLLNTWFNNTPTQSVLILTVPLHLLLSWIHNCIPDACPMHSRYQTGNTLGRYYLYEIGFLTVAGGLCMTRFQWKLNLWIWCSGVWLMNCFDRNQCHLGWVDLWDDKDLLGSEVSDHLDHGRPNEPMNFDLPWSEWSRITYPHSDRLKELTLNNLHATRDQQT